MPWVRGFFNLTCRVKTKATSPPQKPKKPITETYPLNPNGSPFGITSVTSTDGRATVLMPHPERVFRAVQNSWQPSQWHEEGAWMRMFRNARVFVG